MAETRGFVTTSQSRPAGSFALTGPHRHELADSMLSVLEALVDAGGKRVLDEKFWPHGATTNGLQCRHLISTAKNDDDKVVMRVTDTGWMVVWVHRRGRARALADLSDVSMALWRLIPAEVDDEEEIRVTAGDLRRILERVDSLYDQVLTDSGSTKDICQEAGGP